MLDILSITTPIFLLMGIGYLAVFGRIVSKTQVQGLGVFVINFALPALIIKALAQRPLDEVLNANYLLAYGLGSVVVFVAALGIARYVQRKSLDVSALYALGMSASNSGFIGYPIAALVVGSPAVVALALNMLIENLLIIPTALALMEVGAQRGASLKTALGQSAVRLTRNPIIIAIVIGTILAMTGITLPAPLFKTIDMLATASAPTALFVIGGTLYGLRANGLFADVGQIVFGKLLIHPIAVSLAFLIAPPVDPVLMTAAIVMASVPMLSIYPIFGQLYGHEKLCAAALMVATLVSFVTISALIWAVNTSSLFVTSG